MQIFGIDGIKPEDRSKFLYDLWKEYMRDSWLEIDENAYYYALGAVPPLGYITNGFILGEAYAMDLHSIFVEFQGKFYMACSVPMFADRIAKTLISYLTALSGSKSDKVAYLEQYAQACGVPHETVGDLLRIGHYAGMPLQVSDF